MSETNNAGDEERIQRAAAIEKELAAKKASGVRKESEVAALPAQKPSRAAKSPKSAKMPKAERMPPVPRMTKNSAPVPASVKMHELNAPALQKPALDENASAFLE